MISSVYSFWLGDLCLYVGSSPNVKRRLNQHRKDWGSCERLQVVIRGLGWGALRSEVLEEQADRAKLRATEKRWIEKLKPVCNTSTDTKDRGWVIATSEQRAAAGRKGAAATNAEKLPDGRSVNAVKRGRMGSAARVANSTHEQRSEWGREAGRKGAAVMNAKKLPDGRSVNAVKGACTRHHVDRPKADGLCGECAA